ncbi:hypothetical protein BC940DRAFT_295102 [Gongronella butleri]|nr:hypothetical protein BC940DRAFT_295102 [Gongronella butleri]
MHQMTPLSERQCVGCQIDPAFAWCQFLLRAQQRVATPEQPMVRATDITNAKRIRRS